jgi:ribosomal protein S18 acetylase RimI-like enzyme
MIYVREAHREDAGKILDFQLLLAQETENRALDKLIVTKGIKEVFDDPAKGKYYVAEISGKVVGCLLITYEWSEWRNGNIWWLQSVYVDASHRKSGVFRKMYEYIIESINGDQTIAGLRLYVENNNSRAQKIYKALGMNGGYYQVFEWFKE